MPRISLRSYEKQIEDLINQNRLSEAIAHSKHILESYPKCISTYRILAKAFLEAKDYEDASDIFKRVLAVYPDDFISHVGMSIIRENERNLDAAIWHMGLAFDNQASNITIQEELKRLLALRDGEHPAKIRLTRGALVKMYARGELYPQAVEEIKSALIEDPKRLDLKVMLAKMEYLLGNHAESLALCNELITVLPYSYELNKIFVDLLPGTKNADTVNLYKHRLQELDPYEAFVDNSHPAVTDVQDDMVQLDQMQVEPVEEPTTEATWVKSIESNWNEPSNPEAVNWLPKTSELSAQTLQSDAILDEKPQAPTQGTKPLEIEADEEVNQKAEENEELPDWMKAAGWVPTTQTVEPSTEQPEVTSAEQAEVPPAESGEIPDWLRSVEPENVESLNQEKISAEENIPLAAETNSEETRTAAEEETTSVNPKEEEGIPQMNPETSNENELPDWLRNFETEGSGEPAPNSEIPDWLQSIQGTETEPASEIPPEENSLPESATASNEEKPLGEGEPIAPEPEQITASMANTRILDNLSDSGFEESKKPMPLKPPDLSKEWQSASAEEKVPEQPLHEEIEIPDWMRSILDETPTQPVESAKSEEAAPFSTSMQENEGVEAAADLSGAAISDKTGDDLLSWLRDLKTEEEVPSNEPQVEGQGTETQMEYPPFEDTSLDRLQEFTEQPPFQENAHENEEPSAVKPITTPFTTPVTETPEAVNPPDVEAETALEEESAQIPAEFEAKQPIREPMAHEPAIDLGSQLHVLEQSLHANEDLNSIVNQLHELTQTHGSEFQVWQLLGDAYAKSHDFNNALSSYNKAEEILLKS